MSYHAVDDAALLDDAVLGRQALSPDARSSSSQRMGPDVLSQW
jgi:hypothetical protein